MQFKRIIPAFLAVFITIIISGCNGKTSSVDDSLSLLETEIFFDQDISLPEGAKLEVRLEDISKVDVASELVSSAVREIKNRPAYRLQIAFPGDRIKKNRRYGLRASIEIEGKLHFISTTYIDPFALGVTSPIEIKVEPVQG